MRKVFVVSAGRTGTEFLGTVLNEFDGVGAYHEPRPSFRKESNRYYRWKHGSFQRSRVRNFLPLGWYYRLKFYLRRSWLHLRQSGNIYLESNSLLVPFLPEVQRIYPDAEIVHVVRHPGEWARSCMNNGRFLYGRTAQGLPMHPYDSGETSRRDWQNWTPFERATWFWRACNRMIQSHDPELTLTFTSIFDPPHSGFRELLRHLDLPADFDPDLFGTRKNPSFKILPPYEEWDREWRSYFADALEEYEERYLRGEAEVARGEH